MDIGDIDKRLIKNVNSSYKTFEKEGFSFVAIGGYGRGELAPFSDIDVVVLGKQMIEPAWLEKFTADCWSENIRLSCTARTLETLGAEMRADLQLFTAFLERRFLTGSHKTFDDITGIMRDIGMQPARFIYEKMQERDLRHQRMGDSRFFLQPNVKESKGALRDIHTLLWIANFVYGIRTPDGLVSEKLLTAAEARRLTAAYDFFRHVRAHIHEVTGRADDRLTFDVQPEVALRMGYKDAEPHIRAEKFMKEYFKKAIDTGHLTRIICARLEKRHPSGNMSPDLEENINVTIESFAETLFNPNKNPAPLLRRMNEANVISALVPEFANIHAHMQYDMYHVFTADEHTIRAIDHLFHIEHGDGSLLATRLMKTIHSRRALYAAMLFHDIAKGTGEDHSAKGAEIARTRAPELGLDAEETDTCAWLVENHLLMAMTAFKKDLGDEKTVADFVAAVQSPERLKLLVIMTTSDIMAVGPDRWNAWKAGLIDELHAKAQAALAGDAFVPPLPAKLLRNKVTITPRADEGFTEVTICVPDRKGLFAAVAGAMATAGASILDARIHTQIDGTAIDVFRIQNVSGQVYDNAAFLQRILQRALEDKINLKAEVAERQKKLPRRARQFNVVPRVIFDNEASAEATLIEITARDRPGLLFDIASTLTEEGLQISSAKVTTFGARAVDVFYVRDAFGLKIINDDKLHDIGESLKKVI